MGASGPDGGQPPRPATPANLQPNNQDLSEKAIDGEDINQIEDVELDEVDADDFDEVGFAEQVDYLDREDLQDSEEAALAAERLERHMKDRDLVEQLRATNFTGPRYEALATDLAAYGLAVMQAWIQRGVIYRKSAQRGRPVNCPDTVREHLATHLDDREELVLEVVAHALVFFREYALCRRRWSPQGGAALRTFFVGACVAVFANVFRAWYREHEKCLSAQAHGLGGEREQGGTNPLDGATGDDPATIVTRDQWLNHELARIKKENLRYALEAIARHDATYGEIAEELGLSEPAVRMMVHRHWEFRRRQGERETS